ncbi:hypothetical protein RB595_003805 [Gaeumannomyces hyphopodioides]
MEDVQPDPQLLASLKRRRTKLDRPDPQLVPARFSQTKVHGFYNLRPGYELVVVQANAKFKEDPVVERGPDENWWQYKVIRKKLKGILQPKRTTVISCNHNYIKSGISLAQLFFSIWTLYRTNLDQIGQFGYAAFGLTVAPYAWMSIINGLGNLACPQYDCLYIVKSQALRDFNTWRDHPDRTDQEKEQFRVEGEVGTLDEHTDNNLETYHRQRRRLRTLLHMQRNADVTGWEDMILLTKYYVARAVSERFPNLHAKGKSEKDQKIPELETDRLWEQIKTQIWSTVWSFVAAAVPLIIVGAISRFRPGQSTLEERGWTMAWLAFGVLGQLWNAPAVLIEGRPNINKPGDRAKRYHRRLIYLLVVLVSGVPCIGGMVMVVRMIQKFGVCEWLG